MIPRAFFKLSIHWPGLGTKDNRKGKALNNTKGKASPRPKNVNIPNPMMPGWLMATVSAVPIKGAVQGVQAVGRLDQDTTGLLLLTDDGKFIHRMSSPRHHVPKVYEVTVKHPLSDAQVAKLLAGVVLDDDPKPVRAAACEAVSEYHLRLTLTEGKYHQVKRMVAAVSNRVEALQRSQIGGLCLPDDLAPGQWCWLSSSDLARIAA